MEHRLCVVPTICHCCAELGAFDDETSKAVVEVGEKADTEWYKEEKPSGKAGDNEVREGNNSTSC